MSSTDVVEEYVQDKRDPSRSPSVPITGLMVQYYYVYKRELWFMVSGIDTGRGTTNIQRGTHVDETSYGTSRWSFMIDNRIQLDILDSGDVMEVKVSSALEKPARMQLLFYLWYPREIHDIDKDSALAYPTERKRESVVLDETATAEVESTVRGVLNVVGKDSPSQLEKKPYCGTCLYQDLRWMWPMTKTNHHILADGELPREEGTLRIDMLEGETKYLPVESIDALYLRGQISSNTRALGLLNKHGVPVHIFGWKNYYRGSYLPKRSQLSGNIVVEQVRAYDNTERYLCIGYRVIKASIHNIRANLQYYSGRREDFDSVVETLRELKTAVPDTQHIGELRVVEGNARKRYYDCFDSTLEAPFRLAKRGYDPPSNETNALILFLNGIVYTSCVSTIRKTALDPTVGFVHEPGERWFTFSPDTAGIFKSILADRLVFRLVDRKQITTDDFGTELTGYLLTEQGRLTVLEEFEWPLDQTVQHPRLKRKVSFKMLIWTDTYNLGKHLLTGEPYHATEKWWWNASYRRLRYARQEDSYLP